MSDTATLVKSYVVKRVGNTIGRAFVIEHHYSHGISNGAMCWGLYDGEVLAGVIAFAAPNSENVRRAVFGDGPCREGCGYRPSAWTLSHQTTHTVRFHVTELHRLVVLDRYPKNTESFFIGRALRLLRQARPDLWAVLSFADATQGHRGVIYQATNAIYTGVSGAATFYRDPSGRLRHPRQCGVNITGEMARERGWIAEPRLGKHRYLFLLTNNVPLVQLPSLEYPRGTL